MRSLLLALTLSLASPIASASEAVEDVAARKNFSPTEWTDGLHLIAGLGMTGTVLFSDVQQERTGMGIGLKTEVGHYFDNRWAIELSSLVNLSRIHSDFLLWDTQFALGVRSRVGSFFSVWRGEPYARIYGGYGPAVTVYDRPVSGIHRHHIGGPLAGIALGNVYANDSDTTYFGELGIVAHWLRNRDAVREAGVLPEVLARDDVTDGSFTLSLQLSASWLAF